ncbi:MAG: endonuclease/exonuclease/phosphatase family protein [Planctomycetota bacterium]
MSRLLTALLCSLTAAAALAPARGADLPVRIVAFNSEILTAPGVRAGQINKYRFDYARTKHIERVADLIETLNPDILNLAEVTSKEAVDQIVALLHEKGLKEYSGYHVEGNDSFTGMDVACITKFEPDMIDGKAIRTYSSEREDPTWRQAFSAYGYSGERVTHTTSISRNSAYFFTLNGHKLGFLGLHLKSNPDDQYANAKRTAQATVAQRILRAEIAKRGYLPVVLGDLNDYDPDIEDQDETRDTKTEVLRMLKDYDRKQRGDELVNAAKWVPRQADRYTSHWDWNENGARDPQDVFTMIDHVLLPKELAGYVKRVFICHSVSLDTSDHFPVVVDLVLPPAE